MLHKLPIIGIFGHGGDITLERAALARDTGALVARLGAHLLTGGGYGVMAAAAEGFVAVTKRQGLSIGIIPRAPDGPFDMPNRDPGGMPYPNPFVEIAIMTPLPPRTENWRATPARNHINVLTADAIVALPGSSGTDNELTMAAAYRGESALAPNARHTVLLGPLVEFSAEHRAAFVHAATLAGAARHLSRVLRSIGFSPTTELVDDLATS
jgi:uncharacterized protein (TIGR00725 family)